MKGYKVKNLTKESRKFRIHKTAEAFFIRPGEELIVPYPLVVCNPNTFEVTNLDDIQETDEVKELETKKIGKKRTKLEEKN